ncbi:aldo/keto reductase [Haliangium ochraceum]|uniref:Aldo/keto reductase n=1 Tax=Haliangium ochraceum (strain DSM 14365 / JCM 11303 / SMP-2) TaxID=502025 RepID=D0LLH5_HALO1|nr:aldo/keto reductase [Haliangium ochraceum]ACY13192.1 aldo/keto reductase [Haliangium ochraceum DSM 14365]
MEYRNLGASGLKVSTLCLGAMTFGEADESSFMHNVSCDEETSFQIMNRALDLGVNFIDTADVYGQGGLSERVIGKWFAQDGRRDEVVLATKFRFRMGQGPNGTGAARYRIVKTVEDSLRRLGTDRIDLYQIHMQDIDTPEEETLRALDDLVRQGKVLYLGCSNYAAYRLVHSLWTSKTQLLERFVALQAQYSLVVRDLEREHVPVCRDFGLGILPWSPLAGGFLTGKYHKDQEPPEGSRLETWKDRYAGFDSPRNWRILEAAEKVAGELKASVAQVSLAWLLSKPTVSSVIFGARTVEQLEDNVKAAEVTLSAEQVAALDEASDFDLGYPYQFLGNVQSRW